MRKKALALFLMTVLVVCAFPSLSESVSLQGYSKAGFEYVAFGSYPTDQDGTVQPILWRVLRTEGDQAYLLSEYILFAAPVHADYMHYTNWQSSDLYGYLNNEFKNEAFTPAEQAALVPCWEDDGLVTLVSGDDLRDASIGFQSNDDRLCESTAWAKRERPDNKKLQLMIYSKGHKYSPWWSRTISTDNVLQHRRVMDEGKTGRLSVGNPDMGVRPAIYVDMGLLSLAGGTGTKDSPYQLVSIAEPAEETLEIPAEEILETPDAEETKTAEESSAPEGENETVPENDTPETAVEMVSFDNEYTGEGVSPINDLFPVLTDRGFLPDGENEFVYQNDEDGIWLYASQTLRIEINRRTEINSKKQTLHWYEAQIFTRDSDELFGLYPYDEARYTNPYALGLANEIALKHHLVFGINSDYFIYRVGRDKEESYNYPIGIIIRDGKVMYTQSKSSASEAYPPLDLMAFYGDGQVKVFQNELPKDSKQRAAAEKQLAQDLIDSGVTNTLAFGPILVENGQVSPRASAFGVYSNPRTSFGYVEPGHYICVVIQGRVKGEAQGESCVWLAEKMAELGCDCAINLDGGATSTMLFMGQQISKSGNYGDITNRKQNELLGIGISPNVK